MTQADSPLNRKRIPRPSGGATTVRQVAQAAGVSVATVSRVLNGKSTVDPALRAKVDAAAASLAYTPQAAARALATQRFNTVAAIVPTLEDPIFALGVAALQKRLNAAGHTLFLAISNYDADEELRQVRALCAQGVAGVMLVGSQRHPEVYALLQARRIPFVNTWVLDDTHPCIGFDNAGIGRLVAGHLLALGHRRFAAVLQHSLASDRAARRLEGVRSALAAHGIELLQERLIERNHRIEDGQVALREILAAPRGKRPTAIICGTDTIAFGAMVEARTQGLAVPGDLSITGINDAEFAQHLNPPLTTVRLPAADIGARAAEHLLLRIAGGPPDLPASLSFSLVERGSTGRPAR